MDFLAEAGQAYWQVLPLCPTGYGDSPYQSFSTFAGNHYLIDLDMLIEEGLLKQEEVDAINWGREESRVDFGCLYENRLPLLKNAYERFQPDDAFREFVIENKSWLEDFALFMALKAKFNGSPWQNWPIGLMMRLPEVMESYREELRDTIGLHYFLQFKFFQQWTVLRSYAGSKGIKIIGDVPIDRKSVV